MERKSGILTNNCCTCYNCVDRCPSSAISLVKADLDTLVASIDADKCIGCNLCEKVCPIINPVDLVYPQAAYAGVSISPMAKFSASGGLFYEVANYLLNRGYYVYGASYNEDLSVSHIEISSIADLHCLQGSKYVKSNTSGINKSVLERLNNDEKVLFSGTPCQIASLYNYLPSSVSLENLVTIDIVCHGTPSLGLFLHHCWHLEKCNKRKIKRFVFRDNSFGHEHIGRIYYIPKRFFQKSSILYSTEDSYYKLFLDGLIYSEGCYNCVYATPKRCSDITLGDFWGAKNEIPDFYKINKLTKDSSISAFIVNTKKGAQILDAIQNCGVIIERVDYKKITLHNPQLNYPVRINKNERMRVISEYEKEGALGLEKYYRSTTNLSRYYIRIKRFVPRPLKTFLINLFLKNGI